MPLQYVSISACILMGILGFALRASRRMNPTQAFGYQRLRGPHIFRGVFGAMAGIVIVVVVIMAWKGYMSTIKSNFTDETTIAR